MFKLEYIYPEVGAGGFSRNDNDFILYSRIRLLVKPMHHVLDLGAGRGHSVENGPLGKAGLKRLDTLCARLVGADVDPAVKDNPYVAEAHLIGADGTLPFADDSFDMVHSYSVYEHVADAEKFAPEVGRVLKPGGWVVAITPNKWGYGAILARLIPNALHAKVLRLIGHIGKAGERKDDDVFPTVYRLNTIAALRTHFKTDRFNHCSYRYAGPPAYTGGHWVLAIVFLFWEWLLPSFFRRVIHVFIQKRA